MIKMANEKQAIYINKLSYTLYKLKGCNNFNIIVPVEEAVKLSADVAEDMIKQLKKNIYDKEIEQYIKIYMYDHDILNKMPRLSIPEYKKIQKVKPVEKTLYVYTTDGIGYVIDGTKSLFIGRHYSNLKQIYETLVKAINYDENVRIYADNNLAAVYVEDKDVDISLEQTVVLINRVIDVTDGMIPLNYKGEFEKLYLNKIIHYIEVRDTVLAEEIKRVFQDEIQANNFCLILSGRKEHFYALEDEKEQL